MRSERQRVACKCESEKNEVEREDEGEERRRDGRTDIHIWEEWNSCENLSME
jgi:hypothetical protein